MAETSEDIRRVAVIGAGTMGSGIAQVFAQGGRQVLLVDVSEELLLRGREAVRRSLERLVARQRLDAEGRDAILGRISTSLSLEEAAQRDLVVEAVVEDAQIKGRVLRTLDGAAANETILASNTSSISITQLGAATQRPDRVVGMHFMNPAPVMALVEVVRGQVTAERTVQAVARLAEALGKTPVIVQDTPGFVLNRLLIPMINEACYALMEGVARAKDIDTVMQLGANHPMGPLALADLIGLDTCLAIMEVLHRELGDDKYRPCPLLRRLVRAGHLGRKSGQGIYRYNTGATSG